MFNLPPTGLNAIDPKKNDPTKPIKLPSNDVPNGNQDKGNNSIFGQLEKYAHEIAGGTIMACGVAIICGL